MSAESQLVDYISKNSERIKFYNESHVQKTAIVIPALNESKLIPLALASINSSLKNSSDHVVTVVVDNGSNDSTVEIAREFGARVIYEPKKGVGVARQSGLCSLDNNIKLVLTTDADTVVSDQWVSLYQGVFIDNDVVGAYGSIEETTNYPKSYIDKFLLYAFMKVGRLVREYKINKGMILALGNNSAYLKENALAIGGYKRQYLCEDIDLMLRLREAGGKVVYKKEAIVYPSARRNIAKGIPNLILERLIFNLKTRFRSNMEHAGNENDRKDFR